MMKKKKKEKKKKRKKSLVTETSTDPYPETSLVYKIWKSSVGS